MSVLRYGILGSGFMGRTHAEAIRLLDNAELVAVASGSRAPKLAADYGAELCADYAELIARTDIDAVIIATPQYLHAQEAMTAIANDKHLFIEKPMTTTVADAERIIEGCAAKGLTLSVGYQQRYRAVPKGAHDLIRAGEIGQVHTIQFNQAFMLFDDPGFGGNWSWWANPASVGHILAGGVHSIDLCRWMLGAEVESVFGHSRTFREAHEPENTTMGLLTFTNGTVMSLWATSACPAPAFPGQVFRAYIMGENGMIDMDAYDKLQLANDKSWRTILEQPPVNTEHADTAFRMPRMQAYVDQLSDFTNAVLRKQEPPVTGADGLAGVAAALALLTASKTGKLQYLR
ncbi:MAG: Gfo/Idh/MocA family oxidoreductase [Litorilinea sp.]